MLGEILKTLEAHRGKEKDAVPDNVGNDVGSMSVVQLSDRQKKIYDLMKENPFVSVAEMSVVLSVVKRTVERDVATLQKMGVITREGNTRAGHWVILK